MSVQFTDNRIIKAILKYDSSYFWNVGCDIMSEDLTETTEEYLETIYRLQQRDNVARTSEIVDMLKVVPGTVTNTIERLEKDGFITHEPYKGVKLTEKGFKIALDVIRRHRLSERLLTDVLHVSWDKAHKIACKLEHVLKGEVIKNVESILGRPKTCPHGNPIPTRSGNIYEEKTEAITDLKIKERRVIAKIADEDSSLLKQLSTLGLVPGTSVEIVKKSQLNGSISIRVSGAINRISYKMASSIRVKRNPKKDIQQGEQIQVEKKNFPLTLLRNGECGIITFVKYERGQVGWKSKKRLMDMGLTPGIRVRILKSAPFNGPIEVCVRDSKLILGKEVADRIFVERIR